MQVTIKNVNVEWNGPAGKKWGKAVVTYDVNGREQRQNIMSFVNPSVFKQVQEMVNQTVEIETVKNEKGYDEWKSIQVAGSTTSTSTSSAGTASGSASTKVVGSNYETRDERAARQVLIVKQSSLSAAVATLSPGAKTALDPKTVIELAQNYADWVFEQAEEDTE